MQERLATISRLESGAHRPDSKYCFMEAVAFVNEESWTDSPECVCPVIAAYGRALNDSMPDEQRQRLIPFIPLVIGSKASPAIEQQRAFVLADLAVRVIAPSALRNTNLDEQAEILEGLTAITDKESARSAAESARSAAESAGYAGSAAESAGSAARSAGYAARSAEYARSAAEYAARSAAESAARSAAGWDKAIEGLEKVLAIKEEVSNGQEVEEAGR